VTGVGGATGSTMGPGYGVETGAAAPSRAQDDGVIRIFIRCGCRLVPVLWPTAAHGGPHLLGTSGLTSSSLSASSVDGRDLEARRLLPPHSWEGLLLLFQVRLRVPQGVPVVPHDFRIRHRRTGLMVSRFNLHDIYDGAVVELSQCDWRSTGLEPEVLRDVAGWERRGAKGSAGGSFLGSLIRSGVGGDGGRTLRSGQEDERTPCSGLSLVQVMRLGTAEVRWTPLDAGQSGGKRDSDAADKAPRRMPADSSSPPPRAGEGGATDDRFGRIVPRVVRKASSALKNLGVKSIWNVIPSRLHRYNLDDDDNDWSEMTSGRRSKLSGLLDSLVSGSMTAGLASVRLLRQTGRSIVKSLSNNGAIVESPDTGREEADGEREASETLSRGPAIQSLRTILHWPAGRGGARDSVESRHLSYAPWAKRWRDSPSDAAASVSSSQGAAASGRPRPSVRALIWDTLEGDLSAGASGPAPDRLKFAVQLFFLAAIVLSVVAFLLESVPPFQADLEAQGYRSFWFQIDASLVAVFSVEILVKFWACPDRLAYWLPPVDEGPATGHGQSPSHPAVGSGGGSAGLGVGRDGNKAKTGREELRKKLDVLQQSFLTAGSAVANERNRTTAAAADASLLLDGGNSKTNSKTIDEASSLAAAPPPTDGDSVADVARSGHSLDAFRLAVKRAAAAERTKSVAAVPLPTPTEAQVRTKRRVSWMHLLDVVAVAPFFLELAIQGGAPPVIAPGESASNADQGSDARGLQLLRILRLFRVFRLYRLSAASFGVFSRTLRSSAQALGMLIFFVLLGLVIFSSIEYFAERGEWNDSLRAWLSTLDWQCLVPVAPGLGPGVGPLATPARPAPTVDPALGYTSTNDPPLPASGLPEDASERLTFPSPLTLGRVATGWQPAAYDQVNTVRVTGSGSATEGWAAPYSGTAMGRAGPGCVLVEAGPAGLVGLMDCRFEYRAAGRDAALSAAEALGVPAPGVDPLADPPLDDPGLCLPIRVPSSFNSIGDTMWWCAVTMFTVGYGDVVPTSGLGKAIAAVVMLFGILVLALPISVIGTTFAREYGDMVLSGLLGSKIERARVVAAQEAERVLEANRRLRAAQKSAAMELAAERRRERLITIESLRRERIMTERATPTAHTGPGSRAWGGAGTRLDVGM